MVKPSSQSPQWQDKRLEQAFHLIDAACLDWNNRDDGSVGEALHEARDLIETADYEIEQFRTPKGQSND